MHSNVSSYQSESSSSNRAELKKAYDGLIKQADYIGQMVLTFRHPKKDLTVVKAMLRRLNRDVSIHFYGQQAFKRYPNENRIKWMAYAERNTFNDGLHVHLLLIEPNKGYIKPEHKALALSELTQTIKAHWISSGGGLKGEGKPFSDELHLENTQQYLLKQYKQDSDFLLFEHF